MPAEWWSGDTGRERIAALIDWLDEEGYIATIAEAARVTREPWKWSGEFEDFTAAMRHQGVAV